MVKTTPPTHAKPSENILFNLFVQAGIATYNPDKPDRPPNSPNAVYQILPETLMLLKTFGTGKWEPSLKKYFYTRKTLAQRYAKERMQKLVPVKIAPGKEIKISPGAILDRIALAFGSYGL